MVFEFRLPEPGGYPVVTHVMSHIYKGAIGVFEAAEPGAPAVPMDPKAMRH